MTDSTADLPLPPSAITPIIVADALADAKGETRPTNETLPPPGTTRPTFWQGAATKAALVVTVGLMLMYLRGVITDAPVSREALAVALEGAVWAWLAALGINRVDTDNLRWK